MEIQKRGTALMEKGGMTMPDREIVIKMLEEISDYFFDIYRNETDSYKCEKAQEYFDVAIDAIALPKQETELCDMYGRVRLKSKWEAGKLE